MRGKWIWPVSGNQAENERGCFGTVFTLEDMEQEICLNISASTRYIVYLNGREIGRGPIRAGRNEWYYDTYSLEGFVREGRNFLAVRVWNYGWSTYQSFHGPGGLVFEVCQGDAILAVSDEKVRAVMDKGHQSFAPKRNVNLGFTDYYDARKFDADWMGNLHSIETWPCAAEISNVCGTLKTRPIRSFDWKDQYPQHIVAFQQVKRGCQQITLNTRRAFFDDRADANETIFTGFLGTEFESISDMDGVIAFPNRLWNGIIGDFRIDEEWYPVSNENRDIPVHISKGRHFFLLKISGKYDDLYCHLEFHFPYPLEINCKEEEKCFFTAGPIQRIYPVIDGYSRVYGGLNEYNRVEDESEDLHYLSQAVNLREFQERVEKTGCRFRWVEPRYVFEEAYLLSLARTEQVVREEPVTDELMGVLWANDCDTVIQSPAAGEYSRVILDFGDLYVGSFEIFLKAEAGTIIDVYCFENMYGGEIDFTIGLNNGFRYICRGGWQRYRCMTRMGARYAMITVRNTGAPVRIRDFHIRHMTYATYRKGEFACDDFLLNRIWEMCCHTHELCLEDSFTDCPTWEQAFWIGDAQLTAQINASVYGDYELIRRNLELAASASENTRLMNALVPTDWTTSIPMWMMNWVIAIDQYMQITDDDSILETLYGSVKDTLDYYEGFVQPDGAFLISAWNMMDWAALDIENYGVVTGHQAILARCYALGAEFAGKMGHKDEAAHFKSIRERLLQYIDVKMWNSEKDCYMDGWTPDRGMSETTSIQTHTFLYLHDGILDEEKRRKTEEYLVNPPEEFKRAGSPFMLCYLHDSLLRLNKTEEVLDDIRSRWGEMLHYDSTTCWEVFPGFYENSRTRSYCHSWSAAPAIVCLEQILGIVRLEKGWKKIRIQVPEKTGNWCRGAVPTPFGNIRACWERKDKTYKIWIPKQIEVDVEGLADWKVVVCLLGD